MSSSTTWDGQAFGREADQRLTAFKRAVFFALGLIALTVAANVWLYASKPPAIEAFSAKVSKWILPVTLLATVAGVGTVALALANIGRWQATWKQRFEVTEDEWKKMLGALHNQLSESKLWEGRQESIRAELEQTITELTRSKAVLQDDLDKRKLAERALQQHRQELVRSKDVLEMHVQARGEQLQKLQRRYELILNSAGEGICGFDLQGRAAFVNPAAAKMTGWEVEELIGRHEREIFGDNTGDPSPAHGGGLKETTFQRHDGSSFPVELVKTSLQENGREVGAVLIFKDITERKEVEETLARKAEELARSNAELEQFAFVASHDLQEPLRKIQAFGDRLKLKCETVQLGEARDYLDRMQGAAGRMQTLINDLLAFSRVIRSSQPFVPVDLNSVTKEVLGDLEVRIEKTGATIDVGDLPKIDADPLQMRQLMQNLISNALKFQPPDGKPIIRIQAEPVPAATHATLHYQITVEDNGIGFDEKYLEKIFAVFQRLHGRSEYEGTGVGLAVCRRILDRHSGSITAKSKPGQGAKFIMTLPARQQAQATGNSQ